VTMYFFKSVLLKRLSPQKSRSHPGPQVVSGRLLAVSENRYPQVMRRYR
jgi:hypothetical protein